MRLRDLGAVDHAARGHRDVPRVDDDAPELRQSFSVVESSVSVPKQCCQSCALLVASRRATTAGTYGVASPPNVAISRTSVLGYVGPLCGGRQDDGLDAGQRVVSFVPCRLEVEVDGSPRPLDDGVRTVRAAEVGGASPVKRVGG